MADNVPITPGSGRDIATDDVGDVHYQKIKIALGADGAVDTLVDSGQQLAANSVPVVLASDQPDVPVTASSLPLPTGAATAANQATGNSSLSAISSAAGATTDAEATGDGTIVAILKRIRTLINSLTTTVQSISSSAFAAAVGVGGTADAEATGDGSVIAILKRLRTLIGSLVSATITEDAVAGASPTGTMGMAVRADDRYGDYTTNEGDAQALRVNYFGDLYVMDKNAADLLGLIWTSLGYTIGTDTQTVATNTTDIASQTADILTESQIISGATKREDDPHTNNDRGIPALAVRRDTPASGVSADGDYVTINVDASGRLYVRLDELNSIVELLTNALQSNDADALMIESRTPHDSTDSGNPFKIGHVAKNFDSTAPGTPVAEDDRVNSVADVYGRQYVEITHPNYWNVSADYASAQTNTSLKAAPGAGLKLYITDVIISNGATAGNVTLLNGSGGTVLLELYPGINGGLAMPLRTPIALSANTALCITSTTVTTHSVTICGYTAP